MSKNPKPNTPPEGADSSAAASATVKARVLTSCAFGKPDDVVELPAEAAEAGQAAGELDCHPSAVAYAEQLKLPAA